MKAIRSGLWLSMFLAIGCSQNPIGDSTSTGSSMGFGGFTSLGSGNGATSGTTATSSSTPATSTAAGTTTTATNTGQTTATTQTSSSGSGVGSTSTTTSSSGGTTGDCAQNGPNSPTLLCAQPAVDAGDLLASEAVEIDCTVGAGETPVSFDVTTNPAFTTVDSSDLLSTHQAWVTVVPSMLPSAFPDSTITATVTAHFCVAAPTSTMVSWTVLGNTLIADGNSSVRSFASDGTEVTPFLGPTQVPSPTLIAQLGNGNFLAGCAQGTSGCTHSLQLFSAQGSMIGAFDDTNHSNQPLWASGVKPWGFAQDTSGNVWVSGFAGEGQAGVLYVFTSSGGYSATAAQPADPNMALATWTPMGVAALSDGSIVVAMGGAEGDQAYVARYAGSDPTMPSLLPLGWTNCTDNGSGTPSCQTSTFDTADLSGLLDWHGRLIASTAFDSPTQLMAYTDPGLAVTTASAFPTTTVDDFDNDFLAQITPFGSGFLMASYFSYGCVYLILGDTLYPPASLNAQNGCWLENGGSNFALQGLWHITGP